MDKAEWMDSQRHHRNLVVSHKNSTSRCAGLDQVRQTLKFCKMDRIFRVADDGSRQLRATCSAANRHASPA
jgi:hypothetical protein